MLCQRLLMIVHIVVNKIGMFYSEMLFSIKRFRQLQQMRIALIVWSHEVFVVCVSYQTHIRNLIK